MLTMLEDATIFAARRAGARGYMLKGAAPDGIVCAVTAIAIRAAISALSSPRGWRISSPERNRPTARWRRGSGPGRQAVGALGPVASSGRFAGRRQTVLIPDHAMTVCRRLPDSRSSLLILPE